MDEEVRSRFTVQILKEDFEVEPRELVLPEKIFDEAAAHIDLGLGDRFRVTICRNLACCLRADNTEDVTGLEPDTIVFVDSQEA